MYKPHQSYYLSTRPGLDLPIRTGSIKYSILMLFCNFFLEDGKLVAESDSGEFWVAFGGFAPIGKKAISEDDVVLERTPAKIYRYAPLSLSVLFSYFS